MLHYSRHTVKRKWLQDTSSFSANDFAPNDDTYVSISFRKRARVPKSRKMIDKRIQKYFDKAEQDAINQTRNMSERYNNLRSVYDAYMNLSVNQRRKVPTTNMRGYQLDRNGRMLYSFEDNCVYNVSIGSNFNKIVVISIHHKFTDVEKRSIFDNPYTYEPVSPYRIQWPSTDIKGESQLSLIKIENSLANVGNVFKNIENATNTFAETMNKTMENFTSSVNNIAKQNVNIQNNLSDLLGEQMEEEDDEEENNDNVLPSSKYVKQYGKGDFVTYRTDGKPVLGTEKPPIKKRTKRGFSTYNDLINNKGWKDEGGYIYNPKSLPEKQITVNNTVTQENTSNTQVFNTLQVAINNLNAAISKMTAFDISANMSNLYTTISDIAEDVHAIKEHGLGDVNVQVTDSDRLNDILANINTKLSGSQYDETLKQLSDSYQNLVKSILESQGNLSDRITDVINNQNALFARTEQQFKDCVAAAAPNQEAIIPHIDVTASISDTTQQEINSLKDLYQVLNEQYKDFLEQVKQYNTQLTTLTPITKTIQDLGDINTMIDNSRKFYQDLFDKLLASNDTTRKLLTDNQTQNRQMLTDIQQSVDNGITNLGNTIEQNNQLAGLQTAMLHQIGFNTEKMLAQNDYNQWLLQNGINYITGALQDQVYNAYKMLCDRPVTDLYLPVYEKNIQNRLLNDRPDNVRIELIEDANQITPAINTQIVQNGDADNLINLRNEYVFFMNILTNYITDQTFINFAKSIGFNKFFNAYLQRNINDDLFGVFIKLANRVELSEDDYNYMTNLFNSIPLNVDTNINNLIEKTAVDIHNMMNSEN